VKRLLFIVLFCVLVFSPRALAQPAVLPLQKDVVTDYSEYVDRATEDKVKILAQELRRVTSVNLAIVVLRTIGTADADVYGRDLYRQWRVAGSEEALDRGILVMISIVERLVKIIPGRGVEEIFSPQVRHDMEFAILAPLSRGDFSRSVMLAGVAITHLVTNEWPKAGQMRGVINWKKASLPLFFLLLATVALMVVSGGDYLIGFIVLVAGFFGYVLLDSVGMLLGAALAYFLTISGGRK